jgi:dipeptidyl-peptidase 4
MRQMGLASRVSISGLVWLAAFTTVHPSPPTSTVPREVESRLQAIFDRDEFTARSFRGVWLPDGSGYTVVEASGEAAARELVQYDSSSGRRTVLAASLHLTPPGSERPLEVEDYALSPNGDLLLIQTNGREDHERGSRIADYWLLTLGSGSIRQLVADVDPAPIRRSFSPDGRSILYVKEQNLYVHDLHTRRSRPLTADGIIGSVSNGNARWSPNGRRVAYVQSDSSAVGLRPIVDSTEPTYPAVRHVRFARVGTTIPTLRIGVVDADGGQSHWIPIPDAPAGFYLGDVSWAGSSHELFVEKLSRSRDAREFLLANVDTSAIVRVYYESEPAWVDASYRANAGVEWIDGGRAFVVLSEKKGWRQAYVLSRDGKHESLLGPSESDIIARVGVDEKGGWFYYLASPDDATRRYLFRLRLDGKGKPERVTPADQPGVHTYDVSPDGQWAFQTYSRFDAVPVTRLVHLPEHRTVRTLEDNRTLSSMLSPLVTRPTEFFQIDIGGGVVMDAWMIKPRDFDEKKKYPVLVFVYGEPHLQTVLDEWPGAMGMFHRTIADIGYLIVSIDNRGTPAPKGAAWRRAVYGSLGPLSTKEQADGLRELGRMRPYVDMSRVGIWGWSGGGSNTLNALFREPDVYHVGIAVVPKPQPHLYNAWFQEIYMRTLEENAEGYQRSAPINYAEGLKGHLLIVHGTGETNTHLQITEGLVDRLIELGKQFDYMAYPNRNHGLREGPGTPVHVRMLITRYLLERLPPGPL